MTTFISIIAIIITIIIIYCIPAFFDKRTKRLKEYEFYAKEFRKNARPLITDKETPLEILESIRLLNDTIHDKSSAKVIILAFFHHRKMKKTQINMSEENNIHQEITNFFNQRPELKKAYMNAIPCYFAAIVTNSSGIFALLARFSLSVFGSIIDKKLLLKKLEPDLKKMNKDHHINDCHAA